jgi:uncharacterized protein DUF4129
MRQRVRFAGAVLSLLFLTSIAGAAADDPAPPDSSVRRISFSEYRQELARVDRELKSLVDAPEHAHDLRASIPDIWEVQTSSGKFELENEELLEKLDRYANSAVGRGEVLPEMELKVETEIDAAKEFDGPQDTSARAKLDSILQQREYRRLNKTQSPLEGLKEVLLAWILSVLQKFFRSAVSHPHAAKIFLWSLLGSIVLAFAVWIYLLLRRTARDEYSYPRDDGALIPSARHWQQWLKDARAAAERGDWREAVHLAYWSGISYLESSGAWKPDRARTPREYVRMFGEAGERRGSLEALTQRFEFIWYAQQRASMEDFQFSLAQLEKIGCR